MIIDFPGQATHMKSHPLRVRRRNVSNLTNTSGQLLTRNWALKQIVQLFAERGLVPWFEYLSSWNRTSMNLIVKWSGLIGECPSMPVQHTVTANLSFLYLFILSPFTLYILLLLIPPSSVVDDRIPVPAVIDSISVAFIVTFTLSPLLIGACSTHHWHLLVLCLCMSCILQIKSTYDHKYSNLNLRLYAFCCIQCELWLYNLVYIIFWLPLHLFHLCLFWLQLSLRAVRPIYRSNQYNACSYNRVGIRLLLF